MYNVKSVPYSILEFHIAEEEQRKLVVSERTGLVQVQDLDLFS